MADYKYDFDYNPYEGDSLGAEFSRRSADLELQMLNLQSARDALVRTNINPYRGQQNGSSLFGINEPNIWDTNLPKKAAAVVYVPDDPERNRASSNHIFLDQAKLRQYGYPVDDTIMHEAEHLLMKKGVGSANKYYDKFDELVGDPTGATRYLLAKSIPQLGKYLNEKYGVPLDSYLDEESFKQFDKPHRMLDEQFASLSAIEQKYKIRLMDDPVVRKVFNTPALRETYDAMTGLRQTRLDARDLPPYTRIPEKPEAKQTVQDKVQFMPFLDKIKAKLGLK